MNELPFEPDFMVPGTLTVVGGPPHLYTKFLMTQLADAAAIYKGGEGGPVSVALLSAINANEQFRWRRFSSWETLTALLCAEVIVIDGLHLTCSSDQELLARLRLLKLEAVRSCCSIVVGLPLRPDCDLFDCPTIADLPPAVDESDAADVAVTAWFGLEDGSAEIMVDRLRLDRHDLYPVEWSDAAWRSRG